MQGDVRLVLLDGTYVLESPIELCEDGTAHDSGTNGFSVSIEAAPGAHPILSGGRRLGPWEPVPDRPGVFRAAAPGLRTRQLYVNGIRATRARSEVGLALYEKTRNGFLWHERALLSWPDVAGVEVVGRSEWKMFRCPVASAAATGGRSWTSLVLAQPCWANSQWPGEARFDSVAWIENALELLDSPGEWFLDERAGIMYYAPRPGESLDSAEAVAPVLETLVRATGGTDAGGAPAFLHDVKLSGIGFRYTTWLGPNDPSGYSDLQAGFHRVGYDDRIARTPSALAVLRARRVHVERCAFAHLGGAALSVEAGSKEVTILGNAFADISSTAIQVGDVGNAATTEDVWKTQAVTVSNNLVRRAGVEYEGAVGILLGYGEGARIEHNDVGELPYTGISAGWGWDLEPASYARNNVVSANSVHDVMTVLNDGGGIYTLGPQPGSAVLGNLLERVHTVAVYHDEGTTGFSTTQNVMDGYVYWLRIWTDSIRDNVITGNYGTVDSAYCDGQPGASASCNFAGNVVADNVFTTPWPDPALLVCDGAGLEPEYRDLYGP